VRVIRIAVPQAATTRDLFFSTFHSHSISIKLSSFWRQSYLWQIVAAGFRWTGGKRAKCAAAHLRYVRAERWRMLEAAARYYADDS
jgi:hypothetical protein